jgi:WD40 repeat protein
MELKSSFIGHKYRCFDVRFNSICTTESARMLTASEDGTAKLWNVNSRKCLFTFNHNQECEVLRVAFLDDIGNTVITCGADGKAIIWSKKNADVNDSGVSISVGVGNIEETTTKKKKLPKYEQACCLDHGDTQIYACEPILATSNAENQNQSQNHYRGLLTAADDSLYFWDLTVNAGSLPYIRTFSKVTDKDEDDEERTSTRTRTYGGERNEEDAAYIFDAKLCPMNYNKVALALSDGTVRIVDISDTDSASASTATVTATDTDKDNNNSNKQTEDEDGGGVGAETNIARAIRDTTHVLDIGGFVFELNRKAADAAAAKSKAGTQSKKSKGEGEKEEAAVNTEIKQVVTHSTCVSWFPDATGLLVALGDGSILVLDITSDDCYVARALLKGHERGCFGVLCRSISSTDTSSSSSSLLSTSSIGEKRKSVSVNIDAAAVTTVRALSWSSDGSLCEWDVTNTKKETNYSFNSSSSVRIGAMAKPLQKIVLKDYPIYCAAFLELDKADGGNGDKEKIREGEVYIACAGGGGAGGAFMGVPVNLVSHSTDHRK